MGARRGGKRGHLPPPWKFTDMGGPPKDNLTRNFLKKIKGPPIASKETDLRGPHIVCEELI